MIYFFVKNVCYFSEVANYGSVRDSIMLRDKEDSWVKIIVSFFYLLKYVHPKLDTLFCRK